MDLHDRPCFCDKQHNSCSFFMHGKNGEFKPHLNCFSCGEQKYDLTEEEILELELNQNVLSINTAPRPVNPIERGVIAPMADRGISKETADRFRVETLFHDNSPVAHAFNHYGEDGTIVAQKIKHFDKRMKWNGDHSRISMFGANLFPAGGKYLTITEGEEDAMAAYQMLKAASPAYEPAVISIPDGALSAEKSCKGAWEYINSFSNIILAFDGDEPGRKAAEKVARLFDYRPKLLLFTEYKKDPSGASQFKDANDYLKAGKQREFINFWWKAERVTPKGVRSFKSLWDDMVKTETNTRVDYPWPGMNELLPGMTTGHFIVIKAPPKVGKTSILKELAYHIHAVSPYNVGLIFLENTKKEIGLGLCALHMNKIIKPWEIPTDLTELQLAHEKLSLDDRITIFDPEDDRTVDNIINKIMYFVKAHNCRFIMLDHITMLSYQSEDENERKFLDKLCADLKSLTTKLDICIIAVTHVNDDGKTRGSRASVQLCEALISLERDKTSTDPVVANTTDIVVEDNRWGGCGLACKLWYNPDTGRMTEVDTDLVNERAVQFDD